jgi:hypothetical protein
LTVRHLNQTARLKTLERTLMLALGQGKSRNQTQLLPGEHGRTGELRFTIRDRRNVFGIARGSVQERVSLLE